MTITLGWWIVPVLLLLWSIVFWVKAARAGGGVMAGFFETLVAGLLTLMALAVCVGHWL